MLEILRNAATRFEAHWLSDLLGVICVFALIPLVLFFGEVLQ